MSKTSGDPALPPGSWVRPAIRTCELCARIEPHAPYVGVTEPIARPTMPFCDRCLDDLAELIKVKREKKPAARKKVKQR